MPSFPPDDDETDPADRPRPLFGPAFWIALLFGLACVIAGLAFARLGPECLHPRAPP